MMDGPTQIRSDWDARIWIAGTGEAERQLEVTPAIAGWQSVSVRTYTFRAGQTIAGESAADEMAMVLLSGALTLAVAGPGWSETWECAGRTSVFTGAPFVVYLPPGHTYQMTVHADADCAYGRAPAAGVRPPRLIRPDETQSIADGSGRERQLLTTAVTEHLICTERVVAPGGAAALDVSAASQTPAREQVSYFRLRPETGREAQWRPADTDDSGQALPIAHGDALIIRGAAGQAVAPPDVELYCVSYAVAAELESASGEQGIREMAAGPLAPTRG